MKELIGHKIKSLEIDTLKEYLKVHTESGKTFIYCAEGDCCSETWIEHISGISNAFNNEIKEVEYTSMADLPGTRQEHDSLYCTTLKIGGYGDLKIEYRNSSNGYYGGSLLLVNNEERWRAAYMPNDKVIFKPLDKDF